MGNMHILFQLYGTYKHIFTDVNNFVFIFSAYFVRNSAPFSMAKQLRSAIFGIAATTCIYSNRNIIAATLVYTLRSFVFS